MVFSSADRELLPVADGEHGELLPVITSLDVAAGTSLEVTVGRDMEERTGGAGGEGSSEVSWGESGGQELGIEGANRNRIVVRGVESMETVAQARGRREKVKIDGSE